MKPALLLLSLSVAVAASLLAATAQSSQPADDPVSSVLAGKLPPGYRDWKFISLAREEGDLDDIRAVLGNDTALKAFRGNARPFPEGTIIARLAWSYSPSDVNNEAFGKKQSFVPGTPKNGVQFMIKDSTRFAATGGWGYFHFEDGKPAPESMLKSCFPCHDKIKDRDFVFTNYAH